MYDTLFSHQFRLSKCNRHDLVYLYLWSSSWKGKAISQDSKVGNNEKLQIYNTSKFGMDFYFAYDGQKSIEK